MRNPSPWVDTVVGRRLPADLFTSINEFDNSGFVHSRLTSQNQNVQRLIDIFKGVPLEWGQSRNPTHLSLVIPCKEFSDGFMVRLKELLSLTDKRCLHTLHIQFETSPGSIPENWFDEWDQGPRPPRKIIAWVASIPGGVYKLILDFTKKPVNCICGLSALQNMRLEILHIDLGQSHIGRLCAETLVAIRLNSPSLHTFRLNLSNADDTSGITHTPAFRSLFADLWKGIPPAPIPPRRWPGAESSAEYLQSLHRVELAAQRNAEFERYQRTVHHEHSNPGATADTDRGDVPRPSLIQTIAHWLRSSGMI